LEAAHARVLAGDAQHRKYRRRILRLQQELRHIVTDEAWQAYLKVEEASVARLAHAMDLITAWAFRQGRRR
jgi:hypothetical protein